MEVVDRNRLRTQSLRRGQILQSNPETNPLSIEYYGNMLIRQQYYGLMERLPIEEEPTSPLVRKVSRFRVEPSSEQNTQLIARSPSLAKLENPEFQTRWYFKFFLGTVHNNYAFLDNNKEPHALSVCLTDAENHGIQQYRAILWQKSGCRRICFPYIPNKTYTPREILSYFGMEKIEKNPREIIAPEVQKELLVLEEQEGSVNFKFGVIYAKKGQATDDEMFGNVNGSEEFVHFLNVLGDTIDLKGWTGYRGGLDVKDNMTGVHSVYTMFEGHEVMFHVSVMLPYSKDTQQVERKRHIGNDIAVIVFVDGEPDEELCFKPSSIRTKFTHVFAVIRYSKHTKSYWLSVFSEENVPAYGPPIPVPPRFTNPQEFRSFLITKLMNGEKAAYVSPVFSNKRQRTLESLISGLQNDQWLKPEKFGLKRAVSHAVTNREHKRAFLELGQSLKVNKIMQGHAPTSVNNVGGLLSVKNTPWEPHSVLSNFTRPIICGDNIDNKLLVSCDLGIYLVTEHGARHVFDRSMAACQLSVLEDYGMFIVRIRKHGRVYAIPLSILENERQMTLCRRHVANYYVKKSKGSHIFAVSRQESPYLVLTIAVGKRLSIYKWNANVVWTVSEQPAHQTTCFKKQTDFALTETPITLTIVHDHSDKLLLCVGLRHRFDIINVQTKQVTLLKNIVTYRKPKIVSALDIYDDQNPELLLTFSHSSVFVRLKDNITEVVSFFWNNAPKSIVCAFPYILGFAENSIEIRLMVNGNLVHTHCVPHMTLITAKNDIYFTSSLYSSTPTTLRRRRSTAQHIGQNFMRISLSDLAGLNRIKMSEESVDDIHEIIMRRNKGVSDHHYASNRSLNALNRMKDNPSEQHIRTFSASTAFCSPIVNVRHNSVDITTINEHERRSSADVKVLVKKVIKDQPRAQDKLVESSTSRNTPTSTPKVPQPTLKSSQPEEKRPQPMGNVPQPSTKVSQPVANLPQSSTKVSQPVANLPHSPRKFSQPHTNSLPSKGKIPPTVAPKPFVKSLSASNILVTMEVTKDGHHGDKSTVSPRTKPKVTNEARTHSLPTSPNKVIFLPKSDMFFSPSNGIPESKKRHSVHKSSQHLEEIGARHMINIQKSASIKSLPDVRVTPSVQPTTLGVPEDERPNQRLNSSSNTTRFDSHDGHRPLITHKSTMV